jgi:hypothetical protein
MKKTIFQLIFVYAISLIAAVSLLIFKSRISEGNYLVVQLVLFWCGVLTGMLCFAPRFTVWLTKKIFKNAAVNPEFNPEDYHEDSTCWWIIMVIILLLSVFFKMTLIIPVAVIIQSSYLIFKLVIIHKTLSLTNSQE